MIERIKENIAFIKKEMPKMFEADRKKAQRELNNYKKMLKFFEREGK